MHGYRRHFLKSESGQFRTLPGSGSGPQVQTLTKAMTSILCKGLEGVTRRKYSMSRLILCRRLSGPIWSGSEARPSTTLLTRMKSAAKVWLNRQRALSAGAIV